MKTKYVLLLIGVLAILSSVYLLVKTGNFQDQILSFVCGASLIWGYYDLNKKEKQNNT